MGYGKRFLIALDQLANVAIFNGWPDETVSARSYRLRSDPYWNCMRAFLDRVFFWQGGNHCEQCYSWEQARKDMPREYESVCSVSSVSSD